MSNTTKKKKAPKSGRPKGTPNAEPTTVTVQKTRCPKCGSTDASKPWNKRKRPIDGIHDGKPYDAITWRRKRCSACGQVRDEKEYHYTDLF